MALIGDDDIACRAVVHPKDYIKHPDKLVCPQLQQTSWMQFSNEKLSVNSQALCATEARVHELGMLRAQAVNERARDSGEPEIHEYQGTRLVSVADIRAIANEYHALDVIHDGVPNPEHCNIVRQSVREGKAPPDVRSDIVARLYDTFHKKEFQRAPDLVPAERPAAPPTRRLLEAKEVDGHNVVYLKTEADSRN